MKFRWDKKYLYWGVTAILAIAGGIIFYYIVFHLSDLKKNLFQFIKIAMPIIDGLIISYLLWPIVAFLERLLLYPARDKILCKWPRLKKREEQLLKICRGISILLTFVITGAALAGFFRFVIPQIASSLQSIVTQFPVYVNNLLVWVEKILADNPEFEKVVIDLINTYSKDLEAWLNATLIPQVNALLKSVSMSMLGLVKSLWNLVIGLIISIYLLGNKEKFLAQAKKMIYAFFNVQRANAIIDDARLIDRTFGGFINGKILDSLIIGVLCFICVSIMKLPYPMLLSVIIGVTNVIPFFGPFIGAIPCGLLVLMVNPLQCLYFAIFIFLLQQFDGNFLGPKILGETTGLSSFWVIFSITIFSGLMGVYGMILGVPVFAVFYVLVKRMVDKNLRQKGMPEETELYKCLQKVESQNGQHIFIQKSQQPVKKKEHKAAK